MTAAGRTMLLGACTWIYGEGPLEDAFRRIAEAGCDGVEILGEPERWSPDEVRRLLAAFHLSPLALTAACRVPETRRDLAHPAPAVRAEALAYLTRCLLWAAEVGIPLVQMLPSGESRLSPIETRKNEWRWSVEGMRKAASEGQRLGVRIAIEPLNRYEAYLVTTVEDAHAYIDEVASPWVGMTLDFFHAGIEERSVPHAISVAGDRLWHVHVADTNRHGLGRGHLDVGAVVSALRAIDYTGALVLEVVPPDSDKHSPARTERAPRTIDEHVRESVARLRRELR